MADCPLLLLSAKGLNGFGELFARGKIGTQYEKLIKEL